MTGADKTSLVLTIGKDHPGALLEILTEFAVRGINLTRIESRPTGGGIGDYFFSVDVEGHVDEARVGEALIGLHRICADVRYLGSYPRADRVAPVLRPGVSDAEYAQAQAWLARIRDGRA
jgi:prephenate dehydratase